MTSKNPRIQSITLAYFSGTGCTEAVVDCFEGQLTQLGINVMRVDVSSCSTYETAASDFLMVFSPVYAFRLTEIVEKWIQKLPAAESAQAAVISVSGGGEISPNTACRIRCKRLLKRKGYHVVYEKMIVMPSNFAAPTQQDLAFRLIKVLPEKAKQIIEDILSQRETITRPKLQDRFFASIGRMEHFGAKFFGASIRASNDCNQCGLCIQNCPKKNIQMKNGMPKFGFHCMWCLKCIYACPRHALSPGILKFVIIKEGFNFKQMKELASIYQYDEMKKEHSQNIVWKGVTDYLNE